jgi:hypothetical protein
MAEKNGINFSEDYRKVVKKYWYKSSALEESALLDIYAKQAGLIITKNAIDVTQKRAILKNMS